MNTTYDAIVIGARCAGSPTAMLLARKGYRVLLVDRATFPSDTVSTLVIHARGVAALRRWGLLERVVATGCPPIEAYSFDFGTFTLCGMPRPVDGSSTAYAPRRTVLDKVLVDAAAEAGAEVREHFVVDELIVEDGAVTGIRGHGHGGAAVSERARIVIGADGRYSRVAKAVGAMQYNEKPMLNWPYYTYWSNLPVDGFETFIRPDRGGAAIPTNDGLTLLIVGWPAAEASVYKADVEANYLATLEVVPELAARVRDATREARFAGGSTPNYFRQAHGPGWALVGDAGYSKDPITAQGISDAFHDAEACSAALDDAWSGGRDMAEAMAKFQSQRDLEAAPRYELATQLGTLEPPPPELQQLFASLAGNQAGMDDFASLIAGSLSPADFFKAAA